MRNVSSKQGAYTCTIQAANDIDSDLIAREQADPTLCSSNMIYETIFSSRELKCQLMLSLQTPGNSL